MTEYPQLPVGGPGDAREQVNDRRSRGRVVNLNAEGGPAGDGRTDPEAGRAHCPAPAASHADPGSEHGIRGRDCVAGPHSIPRTLLSVDPQEAM